LRTIAYRIAADCERLLDELLRSERREWSDAIGKILLIARRLSALAAPGRAESGEARAVDDTLKPSMQVREAHDAMVAAFKGIFPAVPMGPGDELIILGLHDLHSQVASLLKEEAMVGSTNDTLPERLPMQGRQTRVLVVDDEQQIRDLLARLLGSMGYEASVAEDGRAALTVVGNGGVDLILTDIEMPRLDGLALLAHLKKDEATRDIPVIVISSLGDIASVVKCIELGAEDHITKPFERLVLRARVRASLERKRLRDLELVQQQRVRELTVAAEAVERLKYVPGSLRAIIEPGDGIARLARVFDRMVTGLRNREAGLEQQLKKLRSELGATGGMDSVAADSSDGPFSTGEMLAGRYEILARLGQGGMGMVYRAKDMKLGEEVAVKVLRKEIVLQDPVVVERLKSEIRLSRKISHRNVVRAHDLGEWQGTHFITMEYVQGLNVEELLARRGRLSIESTLAIGRQLCDALAVAHELGIVHRDIKPANMIVDAAGVLKVMDFGIARSLSPEAKKLTGGGFMVGTPLYMAPEVMRGQAAGAAADMYAVGVVLYECLTGRVPFDEFSPVELLAAIVAGKAPRLSTVVPDAPARLQTLVHQQLSYDASARSSSARDLANQLAEIEYKGQGAA
jgi:CheY-like chemotaxis protein